MPPDWPSNASRLSPNGSRISITHPYISWRATGTFLLAETEPHKQFMDGRCKLQTATSNITIISSCANITNWEELLMWLWLASQGRHHKLQLKLYWLSHAEHTKQTRYRCVQSSKPQIFEKHKLLLAAAVEIMQMFIVMFIVMFI